MGYKTTDGKEANRLHKAGFEIAQLITERDDKDKPTGKLVIEFFKEKEEIYAPAKPVIEPVIIPQNVPEPLKVEEKVIIAPKPVVQKKPKSKR